MKRIKMLIASLVVLVGGMGAVALPTLSYAATPTNAVCQTLGAGSDCKESKNSVSINKVISAVVTTLSIVIGILAVIMIMVGGFRYVTSGGDSSKITSAKNTIVYAIVGLVIAIMAQAIVKFVLDKL